jgi:hydroxypyruvate isomerase
MDIVRAARLPIRAAGPRFQVSPSLPMRTPISRRTALRSFAGVAAVAAFGRSEAAEKKRKKAPATSASNRTVSSSNGIIHQSVCKWCFKDIQLETFAPAAKEMGLLSVELLPPEDFPTLKKYGLLCAMVSNPTGKTPQGVTVGGIPKAFNRLEHHDTLVELYTKRIDEVADAGFQNVICFSGNRDGLDDEQGLENCAIGVKRIIGEAEKRGVNVMMELLNSKVNHKDYMCDHTPWGVELVKRVGSERFKLLYDIYHMQIMEGDVIRTITDNAAYLGHFHTAGNPGRNEFEPSDQQELNYPAIMRAIKATGFKGFVGQEFLPKRDALTSLREAVKLCAV